MRTIHLSSLPALVFFHPFSLFWIAITVDRSNHSDLHLTIAPLRFGLSIQPHFIVFKVSPNVADLIFSIVAISNLTSIFTSSLFNVLAKPTESPIVASLQRTTCLWFLTQSKLLGLDLPSSVALELVIASTIVAMIASIVIIEATIATVIVFAVELSIVVHVQRATHHVLEQLSVKLLTSLLLVHRHHSFA